jgi:hypothetical protein
MAIASLKLTNENTRKPARKPARKPSKKAYTRNEMVRVGGFASVALCGLAVSLPHLAHEVTTLTGAAAVAGWFLAIVIDAGMIVTKAHLSSGGSNKAVAWTVVAACTFVSIALNAHAFYAHADSTFGKIAAIGFGIFLPLFILAQSYLASEILNRK